MYTMDCKDPNCDNCKHASKGQSSEEGNQCKIPETIRQNSEEEDQREFLKTVEEGISKDLLFAVMDKGSCLSTCTKLKEEVHRKIDALIKVLRERELDLCIEIEKEYSAQVQKIDQHVTTKGVDRIMKRYDENKKPPSKTTLVFYSDFDMMKNRLHSFGRLRHEDTEELAKTMYQEFLETGNMGNQFWAGAGYAPSMSSGCSLEGAAMNEKEMPLENEKAIIVDFRVIDQNVHKLLRSKIDEAMAHEVDEEAYLYLIKNYPHLKLEDLNINFKGKVSEDLQTMSEEEKPRRRNHLKFRSQQRKERENQAKLEASERKLKAINEKLKKELKADKIAGRSYVSEDYFQIEKCGKDNSLGKERRKIKTCHQQSTRRDEPEKLSAQIKKRFENLANTTIEGQKRQETAYPSFESTDSVPNKEVGKDSSSLHVKDAEFRSKLESMNKDLNELWILKDLKKDKITCQSSESTDSLLSEEVEKDSSLDEDDIEIISKMETESIPSDLPFSPPLPPKNRFKFGGRPRFGSLLRKKEGRNVPSSPRNSAKSESSGIGETESRESSVSSAVSSGSDTVMKENPSFNEQPDEESSGESLGSSKDEGQDSNPTVALRSSFTKYLEKNQESEWLAPGKSSVQPLSAGNSSKERVVPIFDQELDQWLPKEYNKKMASDWLFPAHK